jgi:Uma2 family endonuclease
MRAQTLASPHYLDTIIYPDSDGQPIADSTIQFHWITTLVGELQCLYDNTPNVFVAGDLFWYPLQGQNQIRRAPDAMVVFGRPKGDRGSYKQWEEDGIAPHGVFEVCSPLDTKKDLEDKLQFYNRYGVEEYYFYDPATNLLKGWQRSRYFLQPIDTMAGWTSPRLKIRFETTDPQKLVIYRPDGRRFASYVEHARRADAAAEARRLIEPRDQTAAAQWLAEQRAQAAEAELARLKALLTNK